MTEEGQVDSLLTAMAMRVALTGGSGVRYIVIRKQGRSNAGAQLACASLLSPEPPFRVCPPFLVKSRNAFSDAPAE